MQQNNRLLAYSHAKQMNNKIVHYTFPSLRAYPERRGQGVVLT